MGLKFRRGTTAQKSGSLAFGEPYVNTDLGTLQIGGASGDITLGASGTGSAGIFSTISGSALDITGNANIHGDLSIGGKIQIGDNSSDTVNVVASLSSSLIPSLDNTFDLGDVTHIWRDLYISTGSIKMVSNGVVISTLSNTGNGFLLDQGVTARGDSSFGTSSAAITSVTGSLRVSGSVSVIGALSASTINGIGNVSLYSTSVDSRLVAAEAFSSSLDTTFATDSQLSSVSGAFATSISASKAEYTSFSASNATTDNTQTENITTAQNSANGAFASASAYSASIYTRDANQDTNITTAQNSANGAFASASAYSASAASALSSVSGAVATSLTDASSSAYSTFAKLNAANIFTGTQTITGSLFVSANLVVQGSSSLQNITASAVSIGTNTVILNTDTPSVRFGGISVADSGSGAGASGSLFWDSLNNSWIYQHPLGGAESAMSAVLISGPKNSGSLGSETRLTLGQVPVAVGDDHIGNSIISASATQVYVSGSLKVADALGLLTVEGNNFSEIYLSSNGAMLLNAGGSGVQIKNNSLAVDNSLTVGTSISSSTITGIGNVTNYSSSVNSRLVAAEAFSSSLDSIFATDSSVTSLSSSVKAVTDTFATSASVASATAASISTLSGSVKTVTDALSGRVSTLEGKDISITLTGDVTGTGTITDLANVSFATTIAANSVALGTDTTGDYVATMTAGAGITVGTATGEGSTPVITNTGVTSITGTTNQVVASASTGGVTLSLPQSIATTSAVAFASVSATGDIVAFSGSDRRLKNNIVNISNALNKVKQLNGVTWNWNEDANEVTKTAPATGLIAQEVQEVLPEVVKEREDGYLGIDYSKMVGLLVEAIKEQQTQITELKAEIEALKK